jgi:ABC-type sugar transport system ATPase subunit
MASIRLEGVTVAYPGVTALDDVTLDVEDGELLVLIGPSGSGKTTLMRVVAGLEYVTHGDVLYGRDVVTTMPPRERDVSMVFQENVVFSHRSVRRNVSFPLEVRGVRRDEIDRRVLTETRTLAIDRFLERMPKDLAAGHQQLVQAARALVRRPSVLLLDEPLSLMDAAARRTMRTEIRLLQRGYGVTTLYATNDHEEAMVLGDRIAVLDEGRIRQIGTPATIYRKPIDLFTAGFVGSPPMSFLPGEVTGREVRLACGSLPLPHGLAPGPVTVGVRAHDWEIGAPAGFAGTVETFENHGDHGYAHVDMSGEEVTVRVNIGGPHVGDTVELWTRRFHVFDTSGRAICHIGRNH